MCEITGRVSSGYDHVTTYRCEVNVSVAILTTACHFYIYSVIILVGYRLTTSILCYNFNDA